MMHGASISHRVRRARRQRGACSRDLRTAIVLCSLAPKFARKIKGLIVKNNDLQWPGNFACKIKDGRRDSAQITMMINADCHGTNSLVGAASNKKPGAVSRPGTNWRSS